MTPIRNIWGVGRNYLDHALELGNTPPPTPMIFLKAGSCITPESEPIKLTADCIHYETELAVQLGDDLSPKSLALALDLTHREAQTEAKKTGYPWTLAKSFRGACPLSRFVEFSQVKAFEELEFLLKINGEMKQHGFSKNMIHGLPRLIAYIRENFPIVPGDLILTGTPKGVGALKPGDVLEAEIKNLLKAQWTIAQ